MYLAGALHDIGKMAVGNGNDKPFCIVDCGANIDCKADRFVDFARLGVAYMKTLGIENPTVCLLYTSLLSQVLVWLHQAATV